MQTPSLHFSPQLTTVLHRGIMGTILAYFFGMSTPKFFRNFHPKFYKILPYSPPSPPHPPKTVGHMFRRRSQSGLAHAPSSHHLPDIKARPRALYIFLNRHTSDTYLPGKSHIPPPGQLVFSTSYQELPSSPPLPKRYPGRAKTAAPSPQTGSIGYPGTKLPSP